MIPSNYGYFQTASQAAGAPIGLLLVVVALRRASVSPVAAHASSHFLMARSH
jgi:hypothetical protein